MQTYVPAEDAVNRAPSGRIRGGVQETRRLRVMLLADELTPDREEHRLLDLAKGLDDRRFRVLITPLRASPWLEGEVCDTASVEVHSLGCRGLWDPALLPRLVSALRQEGVDVIHSFSPSSALIGLAAAAVARTPLKITTVGRGGGPANGVRRSLIDRLIRRSDALVFASETGARRCVAGGVPHEKAQVIYGGVDPEAVRTTLSEREAVRSEHGVLDESWLIGVAGVLEEDAGHGNFLQAASIVRAEVPGTKFMVVGFGPLRAELQRRATILGLDGSVIFAGPQMRLAPYISAMDVAVIPAEDAGCAADFGLKAMALGRPLVATDRGANPELFPMGEVGLIVPPDNPMIMAHAILELMRHPEAVERMRVRGRERFSERFTMARMVSSHEELYTDLWLAYEAKRAPGGENVVRSDG